MISKTIESAFNDQINEELFSAYLYYSMSAYFESLNLVGFGKWMRVQALEEMTHMHRFFKFLVDRGGQPLMKAVAIPATTWESPIAAFQAALLHENHISKRINYLIDLALKESDHAANNFLQFFVGEQVEEEAIAQEWVQHLKLVEGQGQGLFMLDQQAATRVFIMPVGFTY